MSLFAQHGYGKGRPGSDQDKVLAGLGAGYVNGVVLSPRDEAPDSLASYVSLLRDRAPDALLLFDPQFFASVIPGATDGHLPEYTRYYNAGLSLRDFLRVSLIRDTARGAVEYQAELGLDRVVTPALMANGLDNTWMHINMQLSAEAQAVHADMLIEAPLLTSVVIDEPWLGDQANVDFFLNLVTEWDVHGFYILVHRAGPNYPAPFDPVCLQNLLKVVHGLATLNGFEVVCGQSDWSGLLMQAVGAAASATGWTLGLRQWTSSRWEPSTGGRAPLKRYSSQALMGPLTLEELTRVQEAGIGASVMAGTPQDSYLLPRANDENWSPLHQCLQHWAVLAARSKELGALTTVTARLDVVGQWLDNAAAAHKQVHEQGGAELRPGHRPGGADDLPPHLKAWREAIEGFRQTTAL